MENTGDAGPGKGVPESGLSARVFALQGDPVVLNSRNGQEKYSTESIYFRDVFPIKVERFGGEGSIPIAHSKSATV